MEDKKDRRINEIEYDDFLQEAISRRAFKIRKLEEEIMSIQKYFIKKERYKQYPGIVVEFFVDSENKAYCKTVEKTIGFDCTKII